MYKEFWPFLSLRMISLENLGIIDLSVQPEYFDLVTNRTDYVVLKKYK